MRLTIITPEYPPDSGGGIITHYRNLLPALRAAGVTVKVFKGSSQCHVPSEKSRYIYDGFEVEVLTTERFLEYQSRFQHFAQIPSLRDHLAAAYAIFDQVNKYSDIFEICDWGMAYLPWVKNSDIPFVVQMHGSNGQIGFYEFSKHSGLASSYLQLIESVMVSDACAIKTSSHRNAQWWEISGNRNCYVVPPAVPVASLDAAMQPARDHYITLGRIQSWKGPYVACEAWRLLGPDAPTLYWHGRDTIDNESGRLTSQILSQKFRDVWGKKVIPSEQLLPDKVSLSMRLAKGVIIPSTWDVFNFVAAEAMTNQKPLIVSERAGIAEFVKHGISGLIYKDNCPNDLAQCIRVMEGMSDSELLQMGQKARESVINYFDPADIANKSIEVYTQLIRVGNRNKQKNTQILPEPMSPTKEELDYMRHLGPIKIIKYGLKLASKRFVEKSIDVVSK